MSYSSPSRNQATRRAGLLFVIVFLTIFALLPFFFTGLAHKTNSRSLQPDGVARSNAAPIANAPPTVSLTNPPRDAKFNAPSSITINADASDPDGTISKVEFFAGASLIGASTTAPYSIVWPNVSACTYYLTARATDNLGATTVSAPVLVTVGGNVVGEATPPNFKVAFFGDEGLGANSAAVLNLVKNEGAHALVISGDLDYSDNPATWEAQLNGILGSDFPVLTLIGNHDALAWQGTGGYQQLIEARFNRLGISWCGRLGVQSAFHYKGIFFVFTAPGIGAPFETGNEDLYIRDQLAADHSVWSIASWHKDMHFMQAGGKSDETGWGVYEQARAGGAIIATAHEHSYFRTHLLSSMMNQTVASTSNTLTLTHGNSFVFVSGLGGNSIREQLVTGPWIASIYAAPCLPGDTICQNASSYGAMFGVFNVDGQQNKANFYFKDLNGEIVDSFTVISQLDMPAINDLAPSKAAAGGSGLQLTVNGANFIKESVVRVGGSDRLTTFVSPTQLTAQLTSADLQTAGALSITVRNAVTGGGNSAPADFTVESVLNPLPHISSFNPSIALVGGDAFSLTVNGTGFVNSSQVRFNGAERVTTFVSTTRLTAQVLSSDVQTAGSFPITISNPSPGGGTSLEVINFTVSTAPDTMQFAATSRQVSENVNFFDVTLTRTNPTGGAASLDYATSNGTANDRSDYTTALGTLRFAPNETSKTIRIFITDDRFGNGANDAQSETFQINLSNPVGCYIGTPTLTVTIENNEATSGLNPTQEPSFDSNFFVRQHYIDFFNREPDAPGLAFWTNQINECGSDINCRERRKTNVSAAFFLSIEFQQTGYLVYKTFNASFGNIANTPVPLSLREFLSDTQEIGRGVVIGTPGAESLLEQNKVAYFNNFVERARFTAQYPSSMTPAQFVEALNVNIGNSLTQAERDALVEKLTAGTETRSTVLRRVAENGELSRRASNGAFVLMQYYGYLRRNPNETPKLNLDFAGYNFWLNKLNEAGGNFENAEMVKAFITSGEYQQRFGN